MRRLTFYYSSASVAKYCRYLIASFPAPYSGLKAVATPSGDIKFLLNSLAWPNGTVYGGETEGESVSTARIYTSTYVRHYDTWLTEQKYAVFAGTLAGGNRYSFDGNLTNLVSGISNVTRA